MIPLSRFLRRLPKRLWGLCAGRWFYIFGLAAWSVVELALYLTHDRHDFIEMTRSVQTWGIVLTLVYKATVVTIMLLTKPKTTLDRTWIWHTASLGLLFALAAFVSFWPEAVGLPDPGRPLPGEPVPDALVIYTALLFQVWGYINWSALAVLRETWRERGRFAWSGFSRRLKPMSRDAGEVSETG